MAMLLHSVRSWFGAPVTAAAGFSRVPTTAAADEGSGSAAIGHGRCSEDGMRVWSICLWIGSWYCISIFMTLYNKWLFALYGLSFPLLVTAVHFCLKALLARWAMACNGLERSSLSLLSRTGRVTLLTGLTTAADVACSNQSFLFISVTAYTIVKSSTPIWILAFSVCLGLRRCSWRP